MKLSEYIPVLSSLKLNAPNDYSAIIDTYYDNYIFGMTEAEVIAAARAKLLPIISASRPLANDTVLIEFGKLLVEQYKVLGAKNPEYCYQYAVGTDNNFSSEMPPSLLKRESEVVNQIILTSKPRPPIAEGATDHLWQKVMKNITSRLGEENVSVLQETPVNPLKYSAYCTAITTFYEEITNLPVGEAGMLMRESVAPE